MTDFPELDPEIIAHMQTLSDTQEVVSGYQEFLRDTMLDVVMIESEEDAEEAHQFSEILSKGIAAQVLAERFAYSETVLLHMAIRIENDVNTIYEMVSDDMERKKKKRKISKRRSQQMLAYAEGALVCADALRLQIVGDICPNCGTHVLPLNKNEESD